MSEWSSSGFHQLNDGYDLIPHVLGSAVAQLAPDEPVLQEHRDQVADLFWQRFLGQNSGSDYGQAQQSYSTIVNGARDDVARQH